MFNTHYQPHYHPTIKSLWLCSSVYCRPTHQSRRIWLVAAATNQKDTYVQCVSNGIPSFSFNTLRPGDTWAFENWIHSTHRGRNKMANILQITFLSCFFFNRNNVFWFKFHRYLSISSQFTTNRNWLTQRHGTDLVTSHYMDLCEVSSEM